MAVHFTSRDLSEKYNRFARWYDYLEGMLAFLGLRKLRQELVPQATGKVLEVAIGTGQNFQYYRSNCEITAVDVSSGMLKIARKRATKLNSNTQFALSDAEALPFRDHSFDTVVSTLSTCTFPNPATAVREMARVAKLPGRILLLEHGRSDRESLGRWQDRHADTFATRFGCHWNREPLKLAEAADLKIITSERTFFGVVHRIVAVSAMR